MLLQAFRLHLSGQTGNRVGMLYALSGPYLGKAIEAMHGNPAHRWTLAELAAQARLSWSIFAQRFRKRLGGTPIGYLAQWRMMLAKDRLTNGHHTCERSPLGLAMSPRMLPSGVIECSTTASDVAVTRASTRPSFGVKGVACLLDPI